MTIELQILISVITVFVLAAYAQINAERSGIPGVIFLLIVGFLAGPEVLNIISPEVFGSGLKVLISLAVAIIVFEGAFSIKQYEFEKNRKTIRRLVSVGYIITLFGTATISKFILNIPWDIALLFGALAGMTGPTVITPILERISVGKNLKMVSIGEGIFADPIGTITAVVVLEIIRTGSRFNLLELFGSLGIISQRLILGIIIGISAGVAYSYLSKHLKNLSAQVNNLSALAFALSSFGLAEIIMPETGIMAAAMAGLTTAQLGIPHYKAVKKFKNELTFLALSFVFIVLAASIKVADITQLGYRGLLIVLLLIVLVRPIAVSVSTHKSLLSKKEKFFLSNFAPRGIIAVSMVVYASSILVNIGRESDAQILNGLVFLTVVLTILIQGLNAEKLARRLGLIGED